MNDSVAIKIDNVLFEQFGFEKGISTLVLNSSIEMYNHFEFN
jgi:hypothetical protein